MSRETGHDPRTALIETKYYNQVPQPLERWIWKQGLPQAAERVWWFHWHEGRRNGDWCSEVPLKRVAAECCVDPSTVTRAYQLLKSLGLLRREDPGRDPRNPFCQATAITEVRLPRAFVTELGRSPNRPTKAGQAPVSTVKATAVAEAVQCPARLAPTGSASSSTTRPAEAALTWKPNRQQIQEIWGRVSDSERSRYFEASRDRRTHLEFDAETRLTPEDRGWLLEQLAHLATAKPEQPASSAAGERTPKLDYKGQRRLSVLEIARTRKRIVDCVPGPTAGDVLGQVVWAVEQGSLRRFEVPLALNIALKKIREGSWSRPNRMPPQWVPGADPRVHAVPGHCSAA